MALYKKDNITKEYQVKDGRVITTLKVNGSWVCNPSVELFTSLGWELQPEPIVEEVVAESYVPTYSELVESYIREHGYPTYGAELAVINNYAQDPVTYADDYAAYMQVRVDAKEYASSQQYREEESV